MTEPSDAGASADLRSLLFDRRMVVVSGRLDVARSTEVAASLMTLDATGDDHVELRLLSCTASIEDALAIIDVIDVLGVPVHTYALGGVEGGSVGILAAGDRRMMSRHARLHLRDPDVTVSGRALDVERTLADADARRSAYLLRLARSTRRPLAELEAEWALGSYLTSADAVTLGYADEVAASP